MATIARQRLRKLLASKDCVTCASVFDPISIRMADDIGFQVGILGGSVAALMNMGAPDITLLTLSELTLHARRVCNSAEFPVVVDGDHGYGNALNAMRSVSDLENAGAAIITFEDTVLPRAYNQPALSFIPIYEACDKLRAALAARKEPETAIFARTSVKGQPLEEVLDRVKAYNQLDIDGLVLFGLTEKSELKAIAEINNLPLMLISYGEVDIGSTEELAEQNVRIRFSGHKGYEDTVKASYDSLMQLKGDIQPENIQGKDLIKKYTQADLYDELAVKYLGKNQ